MSILLIYMCISVEILERSNIGIQLMIYLEEISCLIKIHISFQSMVVWDMHLGGYLMWWIGRIIDLSMNLCV